MATYEDNLPMLEVKALGGFSMRYGEKTISIGSGKSTKAVKLLQILVCSEGRTVPENDCWICCMGMKISRMLRIICA